MHAAVPALLTAAVLLAPAGIAATGASSADAAGDGASWSLPLVAVSTLLAFAVAGGALGGWVERDRQRAKLGGRRLVVFEVVGRRRVKRSRSVRPTRFSTDRPHPAP